MTDYLYMAGQATVNNRRVWKIDISNMSKVAQTAADYGIIVYALTEDNDYIYCGGNAGAGFKTVWKIQKSDMSKVDETVDFTTEIRVLCNDTDYIYAGGTDKKISKIRKSDMVITNTSAVRSYWITGIACDANYVYCCSEQVTGTVWRLNKSDLSFSMQSPVIASSQYSLCANTDFVFVAITINDIKKIRKSDMAIVGAYDMVDTNIYGMAANDTYLYAGGTSQIVHKIQISDMTLVDETLAYGNDIRAIILRGDYVYYAGVLTKKTYKAEVSTMDKINETIAFNNTVFALSTYSGPINHEVSIDDALSISDNVDLLRGLDLSDSINVSDIITKKDIGKGLTEVMVLSDLLEREVEYFRNYSELISIADLPRKTILKILIEENALEITDVITKISRGFNRYFNETIGLSDSLISVLLTAPEYGIQISYGGESVVLHRPYFEEAVGALGFDYSNFTFKSGSYTSYIDSINNESFTITGFEYKNALSKFTILDTVADACTEVTLFFLNETWNDTYIIERISYRPIGFYKTNDVFEYSITFKKVSK